jgi:hypothetical protein
MHGRLMRVTDNTESHGLLREETKTSNQLTKATPQIKELRLELELPKVAVIDSKLLTPYMVLSLPKSNLQPVVQSLEVVRVAP